jgi:hypothetical protein
VLPGTRSALPVEALHARFGVRDYDVLPGAARLILMRSREGRHSSAAFNWAHLKESFQP